MTYYICPDCKVDFRAEASLQRHMQQTHPRAPVGAAEVARMLEGASFPATADQLIDFAREHGGEGDVAVVQQFRGGTYRTMTDVVRELKAVT